MTNADGSYEFNGYTIPAHMVEAIRRYVDHGIEPGHFLSAVICNNLKEAVARADHWNMQNLPAFVAYFYNDAPSRCWGTPDKMTAWMTAKAAARIEAIK